MSSEFESSQKDIIPQTGFGLALREARLTAGLSVEQLAAKTRISAHYLENLEHEKWQELPAAVYLKGYVRILSTILGAQAPTWINLLPTASRTQLDEPISLEKRKPKSRGPSKTLIMIGLFFYTMVITLLALKMMEPEISVAPITNPTLGSIPKPEAPVAATQPAKVESPPVVAPIPTRIVNVEKPIAEPVSVNFQSKDARLVVKAPTKVAIKVDRENWVIRNVEAGTYQILFQSNVIVKIYDSAKASLLADGKSLQYPSGSEIKLSAGPAQTGHTL